MTALRPPPLDDPAAPRQAVARGLGGYEPGLDGLRGVGMMLMLAFHAEFGFARGAFLALSQFFTLSGFLVTSVLIHGIERRGNVGLKRFWTRRMRRLWPASLLTLAGIAVFGATVATGPQAQALPRQITAAAAHVANWLFVVDNTSYIDQFAAPSPVQHFWSLSLEEQFYVILPLTLVLLLRFTRSRKVLGVAFAGATVFFTGWMAFLHHRGASVDRLYYGTDTRMAEILVGVVLAFFLAGVSVDAIRASRISPYLGWIGFGAYAISWWLFLHVRLAQGAMWQGGIVVFALFGTCTVIVGILSRRGPLRFLSWGPFPPLGRITYGLYLYHLPIFLWLTSDRTGLTQWPLFGLRLIVTFTAAILSYHLLECPIRNGERLTSGRLRLAAGPVAVVAILALAFTTADRNAPDPQGTLRETTSNRSVPPSAPADRVLDVLVISDDGWKPLVDRFQRQAAGDDSLHVVEAGAFDCPELTDGPDGRICSSWQERWPKLVEEADPDVVLLAVDAWPEADLRRLGAGTDQTPTDLVKEVVGSGLDLLSAEGAPVVWAASAPDPVYSGPSSEERAPFRVAMNELLLSRSLLRTTEYLAPRPDVLDEAYLATSEGVVMEALRTHRRRSASGVPRVMVVGDSQAKSIGYGLERLESKTGGAVVWNLGAAGCGIANDGTVRDLVSNAEAEPNPDCVRAVDAWAHDVKVFDPDIVLVLSSLRDLLDRRLPGQDDFQVIGDPDIDAYLLDTYTDAVDTLSAKGATVVWMVPPCVRYESPLGGGGEAPPAFEPARLDHLHSEVLPALRRARPDAVRLYRLDEVLCPDGKFLEDTDDLTDIRPDGIHPSLEASLWLAGLIHDDAVATKPAG